MKSKKFKNNNCKNRWFKFQETNTWSAHEDILRKKSNLEMCNKTQREKHALNDVFDDGIDYDVIDMDTPFLKTKNKEDPMN